MLSQFRQFVYTAHSCPFYEGLLRTVSFTYKDSICYNHHECNQYSILQYPIPKALESFKHSLKHRFEKHLPPESTIGDTDVVPEELLPRVVLAKACRILCTDNYTSFKNLQKNIPARLFEEPEFNEDMKLKDKLATGNLFCYKKRTIDSDDPVEMSWLPMDSAYCNAVTVAEALGNLTHLPNHSLHIDMLRYYLLYIFGIRPVDPFYWNENILVEMSEEIYPVLVNLIDLYRKLGEFKPSNDENFTDGETLNLFHSMNDRIIVCLQSFFKIKRAHSDYIRYIKHILERFEREPDIVEAPGFANLLRDLCIITHVFYPETSELCWNYLYPHQTEILSEQKWPVAPDNTVHPFYVAVRDSNDRLLFHINSLIQKQSLTDITREDLIKSACGTRKFVQTFKYQTKPEVVDITWQLRQSPLELRARLFLKTSDEITKLALKKLFH